MIELQTYFCPCCLSFRSFSPKNVNLIDCILLVTVDEVLVTSYESVRDFTSQKYSENALVFKII